MVDAESVASRLDRLTPLLNELEAIRPGGHDAYMTDFRMRNILVHDYLEIDDEAVWLALGRLDDLRRFAAFAQHLIG